MTCIVIVNTFSENSQKIAYDIESFLTSKGHTAVILPFSGENKVFPQIEYDFSITLGGDGTVLYAARQCALSGKPILPINFGKFGFITAIQPENWQTALNDFLAGTIEITTRSLLCVEVLRDGRSVYLGNALNDVVLTAKRPVKTIILDVEASGIPFGRFRADGIIAATPTGSTAYSAAAGGPIIDPGLDAILFIPVSAFSLSSRPIVLPCNTVLSLTVLPCRNSDFVLSYDGQVYVDIEEGDRIVVTHSPHKVSLIGCNASVFYEALRSKLHWSGAPLD